MIKESIILFLSFFQSQPNNNYDKNISLKHMIIEIKDGRIF